MVCGSEYEKGINNLGVARLGNPDIAHDLERFLLAMKYDWHPKYYRLLRIHTPNPNISIHLVHDCENYSLFRINRLFAHIDSHFQLRRKPEHIVGKCG